MDVRLQVWLTAAAEITAIGVVIGRYIWYRHMPMNPIRWGEDTVRLGMETKELRRRADETLATLLRLNNTPASRL